jgi:rod shape-determining protein MreD
VISIAGVHPDLVVVSVIGWTVLRGTTEGLAWAVIGGLCLDLLSSGPLGVGVLSLVVVSLVARLGYSRVFGVSIALPLFLAFPLSVVYYLGYAFLLYLAGRPIAWDETLMHVVLPASLFNVAVTLVVFPLLRSLHRRTGPEEIGW